MVKYIRAYNLGNDDRTAGMVSEEVSEEEMSQVDAEINNILHLDQEISNEQVSMKRNTRTKELTPC